MAFDFIRSLGRESKFTAGDLVEGLAYLEPVARRAVLFGLEQRLSIGDVIEMTHARARGMQLTPIADAAVTQCARHIRLHYVFWTTLPDGLIAPLIDLGRQVTAAFGGMSWADLQSAYARMEWVDHQVDAEHFLMLVRREGLL